MKLKLSDTRLILLLGLMLACFLGPINASAGSVDDVIKKVDEEYAAGNMDGSTRNDLKFPLQSAKSSAGADYESYIDAFKVLVMAGSGKNIQSDAAVRLMLSTDGL
jgi:hypothetical protein